jgi:hypothetical protein
VKPDVKVVNPLTTGGSTSLDRSIGTMYRHSGTIGTMYLHSGTIGTMYLHSGTIGTMYRHSGTIGTMYTQLRWHCCGETNDSAIRFKP